MYDKDYFFVPNPLNRYTLSARNKFVTNPDGSVDLYLQADSPGKAKEANWLPAPKAQVHSHDAAVLAEGDATFHHRRQLEAAGDHRSQVGNPIGAAHKGCPAFMVGGRSNGVDRGS